MFNFHILKSFHLILSNADITVHTNLHIFKPNIRLFNSYLQLTNAHVDQETWENDQFVCA